MTINTKYQVIGDKLEITTDLLTACKQYAANKGYGDVFEAEFVEVYTAQ